MAYNKIDSDKELSSIIDIVEIEEYKKDLIFELVRKHQ